MKRLIAILLIVFVLIGACGCQTEAQKVSYNLSEQADNFNIIRRLTVINCITGDTLFVMEGKMSITESGTVLRILVEDNGVYHKHMVHLADNVSYVLEDISETYVSKYHYTINFNPKMWIPFDFDTID